MSLDFKKVTYVDGETVIGAKNLNDIQAALLDLDDNKVEKEQGKGLSTNDYSDTDKSKVDTALQATTATTLGPASIASFEAAAADMPLKGLTVNIEPVQSGSGDPSPENVRPISGWTGCNVTRTGKNLCPPILPQSATSNGYLATPQPDGSMLITGTWTGSSNAVIGKDIQTEFLLKAGNYILTGVPSSELYTTYGVRLQLINTGIPGTITIIGYAQGEGLEFTLTKDTKIAVRLYVNNSYASGKTIPNEGIRYYPMIRFASETDATYEPYQGDTYNVAFPSPDPGTVYGGTLDVVNGKLTVTTAHKKIGDLVWEYQSNTELQRFVCRTPSPAAKPASDNLIPDPKLKAEQLTTGPLTWTSTTSDPHNYSISLNTDGLLFVRDEALTTTAALIEKYGDSYICYELATPIVYDLTDIPEITTLLGENNIWADCGDVTVTYGAYLETIKKHAEVVGDSILSAIAPLEASYTASRAYAVGAFLFVGTKFYKVTAAIAEGGTITPDTNVTQTTVAEQLMTLAANI